MIVRRAMINAPIARVLTGFLLAAALQCMSPVESGAQTDTNLTQERRSSSKGQGSDAPAAAVVQVGAGTTSGSTTGNSGPKKDAAETPNKISVPPLPSAKLCDAYKDTPAHKSCLSVTLRQ
jgi:hypothetical protein